MFWTRAFWWDLLTRLRIVDSEPTRHEYEVVDGHPDLEKLLRDAQDRLRRGGLRQ